MPRNGTGTFSLVTNTWNPAVNGVNATSADYQQLVNDVAAAITQSLSADGQTPMTGNLAMGNNRITGLAPAVALTDAVTLGQAPSLLDQWVPLSGTPTYISATSFRVVGDQTQTLQVGRRVKTTNTGGPVTSTILTSVYSSPNTTVTLQNDSGSLDSGLSQVSYGLLSPLNGAAPFIGSSGSTAGRNRIINGSFFINQRVVSGGVVLPAGSYGHDRWKAGAGGCSYTFSASGNDTIISITAGTLVQTIEASSIEGGPYAMSWFGTSTGKIGAGSAGASGVTATATGGVNLNVEFGIGTLTRVQLEPGLVVTPFERRSIAIELPMCKRYYQEILASARGTVANLGGILDVPLGWIEMRATPSFSTQNGPGYATSNISADTLIGATPFGGRYSLTVGAANTDSYVVNRIFRLSAEL